MLIDFAFIDIPARDHPVAAGRLLEGTAPGRILGCWSVEIGQLNQLVLARAHDSAAELGAARADLAWSDDPFGLAGLLRGYRTEAYALPDWFAPILSGRHGPCYELRIYGVRPGSFPVLDAAWQQKLPRRARYSPVIMAGVSVEGTPRFAHLWAYESLAARQAIRARAQADGAWPPGAFPGAPPPPMQTMILTPLPGSPLT